MLISHPHPSRAVLRHPGHPDLTLVHPQQQLTVLCWVRSLPLRCQLHPHHQQQA